MYSIAFLVTKRVGGGRGALRRWARPCTGRSDRRLWGWVLELWLCNVGFDKQCVYYSVLISTIEESPSWHLDTWWPIESSCIPSSSTCCWQICHLPPSQLNRQVDRQSQWVGESCWMQRVVTPFFLFNSTWFNIWKWKWTNCESEETAVNSGGKLLAVGGCHPILSVFLSRIQHLKVKLKVINVLIQIVKVKVRRQ